MSDVKLQYGAKIKCLIPINELSDQLQDEVIDFAEILEFKKKQFVFKEGDEDEFSYYLLDGEIELLVNNKLDNTVIAGTSRANYPMAQLQPRRYSAKTKNNVTVLKLDRSKLDRLMVAGDQDDLSGPVEVHVDDLGEQEDTGDWMTKMLQSEIFSRLPTANIHQLFAMLEPFDYKAGDTVINQGDPGDNYYIIQEGRCEVTRSKKSGDSEVKLAELSTGDGFGEEALLTDARRNASVKMLSDGTLMKLSKSNFINLIKKPVLNAVRYNEAKKLISEGAIWLDVRFKDEYTQSRIDSSLNIPVNGLRMESDQLDKDTKYILYCDNGGRSSAAAFLLTQRGYDVCYLDRGLSTVPDEDLKTEVSAEEEAQVTEAPEAEVQAEIAEKEVAEVSEAAPAEPVPVTEEARPETVEAKSKEAPPEPGVTEEITEEVIGDLAPDIRASVIETELARKQQELDKMTRTDDLNAAARKEQEKERKLLEKERKKLEAAKKAAEKEAEKLRQQETAKIEKLKKDAEKQLAAEKKKLEEIYAKNAAEMEKLQRLKQEAEEQIRKEREKLAQDAEEERAKLEKLAEERRNQQASQEKEIQDKAKALLEGERRKLAEAMSKSSNELAEAQRARVAADAAKKAAQEEAQKIIEEYKIQFARQQAVEKARMEEDKRKLEEESQKIQDSLKDMENAKESAEASRKFAEVEAARLKAQLVREEKENKGEQNTALQDEIKVAEQKLQQARKNVDTAQKAVVTIIEAKEINEQDLQKQSEEVKKFQAQMASDLEEFLTEFEAKEKEYEDNVSQHEYLRRIKERADEAKREAEQATDSLFSDIASQLGRE